MRTFEVNGYPMAYVEDGRGEPLVMVHGFLSDYRYWVRQAGPLSASLRVVSVSLRRHYPERWNGVGDDFTTHITRTSSPSSMCLAPGRCTCSGTRAAATSLTARRSIIPR